MGRTYHFECPQCHYQACVSGGAEQGVNCSVQTVACKNCRELYDVFTRIRKKEFAAETGPKPGSKSNRILQSNEILIPPLMLVEHTLRQFQPANRSKVSAIPSHWENVKLACPVAKSHRVQPWNDPDRCPRCGNYMEKNGFPYRIWD
jgi:hypothetical protein